MLAEGLRLYRLGDRDRTPIFTSATVIVAAEVLELQSAKSRPCLLAANATP